MLIPRTIAAALVVWALTLPAFAQEVVLKVHHFWPPGAMGDEGKDGLGAGQDCERVCLFGQWE